MCIYARTSPLAQGWRHGELDARRPSWASRVRRRGRRVRRVLLRAVMLICACLCMYACLHSCAAPSNTMAAYYVCTRNRLIRSCHQPEVRHTSRAGVNSTQCTRYTRCIRLRACDSVCGPKYFHPVRARPRTCVHDMIMHM